MYSQRFVMEKQATIPLNNNNNNNDNKNKVFNSPGPKAHKVSLLD